MASRDNRFLQRERGSGGVVRWALRQSMAWVAGGLVVYALIANFGLLTPQEGTRNPTAEAAAPARSPPEMVSNSLILRAAHDGYVYVDAAVNGLPLRMAFDTGASYVALTEADAAKAGIAGGLDYSLAFDTANGRADGAPVTLREVRIGQFVIADVPAIVMRHLAVSLLGQTFLNRLASYHMSDGILTLTW